MMKTARLVAIVLMMVFWPSSLFAGQQGTPSATLSNVAIVESGGKAAFYACLRISNPKTEVPLRFIGRKKKGILHLDIDREIELELSDDDGRTWRNDLSQIYERIEPGDVLTIAPGESATVRVRWNHYYLVHGSGRTLYRYVLNPADHEPFRSDAFRFPNSVEVVFERD